MVAAVSAIAEQVLRVALSPLVEAELIFQHGVPPDARYQSSVGTRRSSSTLEIGWANYDPQSSPTHVFLFGGHDPGVCSRMMGSLALWSIGALDRARTAIEQGISLLRDAKAQFGPGGPTKASAASPSWCLPPKCTPILARTLATKGTP
jgi:hypothetical protein